MKNIDRYVFEHVGWKKELGYTIRMDDCRHYAQDATLKELHQCSREGKHLIGGYKFCTQHAKMVRKELSIEEGEE
jgi:hypothetical protein